MISHDSMMSFIQSSNTRGSQVPQGSNDGLSRSPEVSTVGASVVTSSDVMSTTVIREKCSSPGPSRNEKIKLEKSKFVTPKLVTKEVLSENILKDLQF